MPGRLDLAPRATLAVLASFALLVSSAPARAQEPGLPHAAANQLHAAIANGDPSAVEYWLAVRHVDPKAPSAAEPDVTPLARCLSLASRVLDGPGGKPTGPGAAPETLVGLRALQDIVAILAAHGAALSDSERARFSPPVLRWYDDAIGHPPAATTSPAPVSTAAPATPPPTAPAPQSAVPPSAPPVIDIARRETLVVVSPDPKRSCNGNGHVVFLVNNALMPITARVVTHGEKPGEAKPQSRTDTYALEPGATWELGCDTLPGDGRVKYELKEWKY